MFLAGYATQFIASTAAYCAIGCCSAASKEVLRHSARVAWSCLFFLAMVTAWLMRDFAKPLLEKLPWIIRDAAASELGDKWFGQQAVYRVSMGNFLFFATMSLSLIGVKYKSDKRDTYLHHGHWMLKLGAWLVFTALPFLLHNDVIDAYSWAARFGSGIFLIIQMVILLDFVASINETWVANAEDNEKWLYALMTVTVAAYAGALTLAGFMFYWFKPSGAGSCSLNIALITTSLLLVVGFSTLSIAPFVKQGSIFPAACIGLYCMYLCFSALQSEPHDYECNGLGQQLTAASGTTLAVGMLFTLGAVVYAAFRAGSNTGLFRLDGSDAGDLPSEQSALLETSAGLDGVPEGQVADRGSERKETAMDDFIPVTYNYSFFHLIFALASMYIAMLLTGWGSVAQEKDRIDVGWSSVWVKIGAQWCTGIMYLWTLVAPVLMPERFQ
ncbi:MAG: hypothetical protein WDW38_005597 [Sanguina aurantia]